MCLLYVGVPLLAWLFFGPLWAVLSLIVVILIGILAKK